MTWGILIAAATFVFAASAYGSLRKVLPRLVNFWECRNHNWGTLCGKCHDSEWIKGEKNSWRNFSKVLWKANHSQKADFSTEYEGLGKALPALRILPWHPWLDSVYFLYFNKPKWFSCLAPQIDSRQPQTKSCLILKS